MKVQVTESGTWRRTLEIEAPAEAVTERLQAAYKKYSKTLNLPGFRRGKVPVALVEKQFGPAIQGEVVQEMVKEFYREASEAEGLQPVSEASIEDIDFEEGQPLVFKASVDVCPELNVEHYKKLRVTRPIFPITQDHVENQLKSIQEQNAAEQVVERPATVGDVLTADVQELDESGVPIAGRKQEDQQLRLWKDENDTPSDLANQLEGVSTGDSRQITLTHTEQDDHEDHDHEDHDHEDHDHDDHEHEDHEHEDHDHEDHDHEDHETEQEVRFEVTVKEVRERSLPELDDEFAKDLGDFETLDALKEQIQTDLQAQSDAASRRRVEDNLVDALIDQNDFELPDSMVENYLDNVVESFKQEHAGHDHPIDDDLLREEGRGPAIRGIKRHLLLDAIVRQETIQVTEEDVDRHLAAMAQGYNMEVARLREVLSRSNRLEQIESDLQTEKTFDFLIGQARIEDLEEVEAED